MQRVIFLLGGMDLEMLSIKEILQENGVKYVDKNLSWGAKLSEYKDIINKANEYDKIYGIELIEDIKTPKNYIAIDHHGKKWCRPSAIEQVAEILNIKLNYKQLLIAANDRGYIEAMRQMGASKSEIEDIRRQDRKAQGVTPKEEKIAKEEAKRVQQKDGIWIIQTTLKHFSPLSDILLIEDKKPLIIYNDESLIYYGNRVLKLSEIFAKDIKDNLAYYGGNPPGYFGFTKEWIDKNKIDKAIEQILKVSKNSEDIHSYHIFMLPFTIGNTKAKNNKGKWQKYPFSFDETTKYNEYTYFYNYVRRVLFTSNEDKEPISEYYKYNGSEKGEYSITVKGKIYRLELDGIALREFKNGIGILSLHLKNRKYSKIEDILAINDFGRRIFPQFLGDGFVEATKNVLLACELSLKIDDQEPIIEDFSYYNSLENIQKSAIYKLPNFFEKILSEFYQDINKIEPIIDDRMYLMCHFMSEKYSKKFKNSYKSEICWYQYIFVDGGYATCQDKEMLRNLISKSTYPRWSGYNTLFGITRYSFMILSDRDVFSKNILNTHLQTIYFQMATLLLAYRAMILQFSDKVTEILKDKDLEKRKQKAKELFDDYLDFKNNIYFQEVTAQEQGIDLFNMAKEQMKLEKYIHELDNDIDELHNFIQINIEDKRNEQGLMLNKLAATFMPPTLLAGMYGMNFIDFDQHNGLYALGAVMLIITSGVVGFIAISSKSKKFRIFLVVLLSIIFALSILCYPYPNSNSDTKENKVCKLLIKD